MTPLVFVIGCKSSDLSELMNICFKSRGKYYENVMAISIVCVIFALFALFA
jgi:hypothetical protein